MKAERIIKDIILVSCGIISAGFGLKGFLLPNNFIDGGSTGLALLASEITGMSFPVLLLIINAPFIYLAYKVLGKHFAIKTGIAIIGLSACVAFLPYPIMTNDKLLISVFGGMFLGAGIGISVRGGSVIDGTEVLAIFLSRKTGRTMGEIILVLNIIIFSVAAYVLSIETALYSILTYLSASKMVDFIIEGIEEYIGVTIVSNKPNEVSDYITQHMQRGMTVYKGEKGFGKRGESDSDVKIIFTVITRLEENNLKTAVQQIDSEAFIVMHNVKDTKGGIIKKRPLEEVH